MRRIHYFFNIWNSVHNKISCANKIQVQHHHMF
jgi:hypothetical protein